VAEPVRVRHPGPGREDDEEVLGPERNAREVIHGDMFDEADLGAPRAHELHQRRGVLGARQDDRDIGVGGPEGANQQGERGDGQCR
jgi:hypothetical protein